MNVDSVLSLPYGQTVRASLSISLIYVYSILLTLHMSLLSFGLFETECLVGAGVDGGVRRS